jgi:hypothetical protein
MAKAKKKSSTTAKKSTKPATKKPAPAKKPVAKKPAAKKPAATKPVVAKKPAAKKPAAKKALTVDARRKLLKPHTDYEKLVEQIAVNWEESRVLKVPSLSAARLRKLAADAQRAVVKETSLRVKLEAKIDAVYDARLLAEDALWRAILDVNAAVKLFARSDETLPERFWFLSDALTGARPTADPGEPAGPAAPVVPTV